MPIPKFPFRKSRNLPEGALPQTGPVMPQAAEAAPGVPDTMCTRCPGCGKTQFNTEIDENYHTCPDCGYHFRLSALQRLELVCDEASFYPWDEDLRPLDPLDFPGYGSKLKKSRTASSQREAVLTGKATIGGQPCAVFAMEPQFMMGSMGSVVGEKITRLFERATTEKLPVVGFTVSGGARMQEGAYSLMQMAKTSGAVKLHSDAGLLYVAVITDPTTGGVTASFAMEGDILLSEPGALIAFAGPRVIEQTIRQKLPKNFQRAEYLLEHGFLDAVIARPKLKRTLTYILKLHAPAAKKEA